MTKNQHVAKEWNHLYTTMNGRRIQALGVVNGESSQPEGTTTDSKKDSSSSSSKTAVLILPEEQEQQQQPKDSATQMVEDKECSIAPQEPEKELSETQKLLKQVKEAGTAGVISYALWELGFWALSVPVCISAYYGLFGHFPDLTDKEDLSKLGGEAFAFVNFARFAVPLRIGLALSTTPWIQENVVDKFFNKKNSSEGENCQEEEEKDKEG